MRALPSPKPEAFHKVAVTASSVFMSQASSFRLSSLSKAVFSHLQSDLLHAKREARLNKCNYCLGFSACFIAVTLVAFMYTALGFAPIFFLELSETQFSQVDLRIKASKDAHASLLNFTAIEGKFVGTDQEYSSMRIVQDRANVYASCNSAVESDVSLRYSKCTTPPFCLPKLCYKMSEAQAFAIDFEREDRMRVGSRWYMQPPPLGSVLVQSDLMATADLRVGDTIFVELNASTFFGAIQTANSSSQCNMSQSPAHCHVTFLNPPSVYALMKISGSFSDSGGKFAEENTNVVVMSIATYHQALVKDLDPAYASDLALLAAAADLLNFAPEVIFNLPPPNRLKTYLSSSWPDVQAALILFSGRVSEGVGIGVVELKLPLLSSLLLYNTISMFFSLVISIITAVLITLLALLIYSLLLISVESRNFDIAVMRMVGTSRLGVCRLIIVQSLFIAVPPWILGLLCAIPLIKMALGAVVEGRSESLNISPSAFFWASLVGIFVPVLSSLLPIQAALSTALAQALDYTRPKSAAVTYTIERASDRAIPRFAVAAGCLFSLMGIVLYVALPSALLSLNLFLLLAIFFSLLMAILLGLVMIGMNMQHAAETLVLYAAFFWLPSSLRQLVRKNLISHKLRNRKTFLMYSLSLAFIVFIYVSFTMQFVAQEYQILQQNGAPLRITFSSQQCQLSTLPLINSWVQQNKEKGVEGMGWISQSLGFYRDQKQVQIENIGHTYRADQILYATSPNLFDICPSQFLRVAAAQPSRYSVSEDLYSQRGGSSAIIGSLYMRNIGIYVDPSPTSFLLRSSVSIPNASSPDGQSSRAALFRLQPSALLDGAPGLSFSKYPERVRQDILVPIPTYMALMEGLNQGEYSSTVKVNRVGDIDIGRVLFKLRNGISNEELGKLKMSLQLFLTSNDLFGRIFSFADSVASLETAVRTTTIITNFTTVVAMIVCFFSLAASMFANISESGKEIGILRAMGMRRTRLCAVFAIEAVVLIISASAAGCAIGMIVGSAVSANRALFSQLPVPIVFPNSLVTYVIVAAIISGVASSIAPAHFKMRDSVVNNIRS